MCSSLQNVCHTLWCSVGTTCHSKLDAAVDGTSCGESKVGHKKHRFNPWIRKVPGSGRSGEKEMENHPSILVWENLMNRTTWRATAYWDCRVKHD